MPHRDRNIWSAASKGQRKHALMHASMFGCAWSVPADMLHAATAAGRAHNRGIMSTKPANIRESGAQTGRLAGRHAGGRTCVVADRKDLRGMGGGKGDGVSRLGLDERRCTRQPAEGGSCVQHIGTCACQRPASAGLHAWLAFLWCLMLCSALLAAGGAGAAALLARPTFVATRICSRAKPIQKAPSAGLGLEEGVSCHG